MDGLFENFLNTISYNYYPKGLHESSEEYFNSPERNNFLKLLDRWDNFMKNDLKKLILELDKNLEYDLIINDCAHNFPCFMIEIIRDKKLFYTTTIYISFFIPFYHIVDLTGNLISQKVEHQYDIDSKLDKIVQKIIKKNINYSKFPECFLKKTIPDIKISENFNYTSAFFTENYRISFF